MHLTLTEFCQILVDSPAPTGSPITMSSEKNQIAELLAFTDQLLCSNGEQPLSDVNKSILEQALQGRKLMDIMVVGYSPNVVQRIFAPRLWELLTTVTKQKVGIKNVRLLLENQLKESSLKPAQPPQLGSPSSQSEAQSEATLAPSQAASVSRDKITRDIIENIPAPTCTTFIGREAEINRLMELISPHHSAHLITVDGIGGVGKTSLVVECARRCLQASKNIDSNNQNSACSHIPRFAAFVFVSAKLSHLESFGLIERLDPSRSLRDIFQQIADTLGLDLAGASIKEQVSLLKKALSQRPTLLIVDNLETVENPQEVIGFLYDLPASVKVVITTREQILFVPVRLAAMPEPDGLELINYEANEKDVTLSLADCQALYKATGGIPVAVRYAMGQLANGYLLQEVLAGINQATSDVARFCFENSVQPMRGQPAHQLLMALALLPTPVLRNALTEVTLPDASPDVAQQALARLRGLSLVSQTDHRYSMLPLTREYALAELKAYPEFANEVRQRWINWFLRFSETYAKQDAKIWKSTFDGLEEEWQNLRAIADWCMVKNNYEEMLQLWKNVEPYTYAMGRRKERKGYWDDRLLWTSWLIQTASEQSDWVAATQVMLDRAWTLIATRRRQPLAEAEQLLEQVWDLRHYQSPQFQSDLAQKMAVLRIQQEQFEQAQSWLDQTEAALAQIQLEEKEYLRHVVQIQYYRGMSHFKLGQIATAKQQFIESRQKGLTLGWERAVRMAENWLADIAVLEGDFDQAEQLLVEGLRVAQANQDLTLIAFVKQSFAGLVYARGDVLAAKRWAIEALEIFSSLEMLHMVEEMQVFLSSLNNEQINKIDAE